MRLTLKQKIELIKTGKAYVVKCDGGYFLYIKTDNGQIVKRLKKDDFTELDYEQSLLK